MDFSLQQSLAPSPWNLKRLRKLGSSLGTFSSSSSSSSQMAMIMARRSKLRGVKCRSVDGEEGGISEENPKIRSWNSSSPSGNLDQFLGWAPNGSQINGANASGWIKIGGVVLLGIGFSLGARGLYARKDASREFAVTPPIIESVSTSKGLEDAETNSTSDGSGESIQYSINDQDKTLKDQRETHIDVSVPDIHVQENRDGENIEKIDNFASTGSLEEKEEPLQAAESDTPLSISEDVTLEGANISGDAIDTDIPDLAITTMADEEAVAESNDVSFNSEISDNVEEDSAAPSIVLTVDDSLKEALTIAEHQDSVSYTVEEDISVPLTVLPENGSFTEEVAISEEHNFFLFGPAKEDSSTPSSVLAEDDSQKETLIILEEHQGTPSVLDETDLFLIDDVEKTLQNLEIVSDQQNDISKTEPGSSVTETGHAYLSIGITAPRTPSSQLPKTGQVVVGASVDHMQEQVMVALQGLKVIEAGVEPSCICKRRDYARWLIGASAALSRSPSHKVFPAMYIENVTKLAYDDVQPEDPDFPFIQGLAEAGLISSRLLQDDSLQTGNIDDIDSTFSPDSPLTRQDLLTWKMALEWKPVFSPAIPATTGKEKLREACGFIDIDKIHRDAIPALLEDATAGERSIVALAFGYTRRFQPEKPVTKSQAAVALSTGEAWDVISEELARIEADSIAEAAVAAELALEKRTQQEMAAEFEGLLQVETEKHHAASKLVEMMKAELEQLKLERDEEKYTLLKERALLDAEKDFLLSFRRDVDNQALALSTEKLEAVFEREKANKLFTEAEKEKAVINELRLEVEVERNALALARIWAEDEARKAQSHAKVLEEMRQKLSSEELERRAKEHTEEVREPPAQNNEVSEGEPMKNSEIEGVDQLNKATDLQFTGPTYTEPKLPQLSIDGLITKTKDLVDLFVEAVLRLLRFVYIVFHTVERRVIELAGGFQEKFQEAKINGTNIITKAVEDVKMGVPKAVDEIKVTVPAAVAGVTSSIRDGTLKVVDGWREGAERIVQKLKVP